MKNTSTGQLQHKCGKYSHKTQLRILRQTTRLRRTCLMFFFHKSLVTKAKTSCVEAGIVANDCQSSTFVHSVVMSASLLKTNLKRFRCWDMS